MNENYSSEIRQLPVEDNVWRTIVNREPTREG